MNAIKSPTDGGIFANVFKKQEYDWARLVQQLKSADYRLNTFLSSIVHHHKSNQFPQACQNLISSLAQTDWVHNILVSSFNAALKKVK